MQISNVKSLMNTIKVAPLAILIAGATNACVEVGVNYRTQSQSNAAKYLSGKEFLDAKKHVIENNLCSCLCKCCSEGETDTIRCSCYKSHLTFK